MPLNVRMVEVITQHADLLDEPDMPKSLLDTCTHVAAYQPVIKQWEKGDLSEHTSIIDFPGQQVLGFASRGFTHLKAEQRDLLGRSTRGSTSPT